MAAIIIQMTANVKLLAKLSRSEKRNSEGDFINMIIKDVNAQCVKLLKPGYIAADKWI